MSKSEKIQARKLTITLLSVLVLAVVLLLTVGRERHQSSGEARMIASNHLLVTAKRIPADVQLEDEVDGIVVTAKRQRLAQVWGIGQAAK